MNFSAPETLRAFAGMQMDHCQVFKYLGDDTKLYDQIWTEIISEF